MYIFRIEYNEDADFPRINAKFFKAESEDQAVKSFKDIFWGIDGITDVQKVDNVHEDVYDCSKQEWV